jgi:hypothetical protein
MKQMVHPPSAQQIMNAISALDYSELVELNTNE